MKLTKEYPIFIQSEEIAFDKRFTNEDGQSELCHHTGREVWNSDDIADHWFEYIDSKGGLHYGR